MSFINIYFAENKYVIDKEEFQIYSDFPLNSDSITLPKNLDVCVSLNDSIVQKFVDFFQYKIILLDSKVVVAFDLLADMFQIKTLKRLTNKFKHTHTLEIVQNFFENYNGTINSIYEELISKVLISFINEPKLLKFTIPEIYKILQNYLQENTNNLSVVMFMFKYFDFHGKDSSIIFSLVERLLCDEDEDYFLNILYQNYKDEFNFHYLQSSHLFFLFESYINVSVKYNSVKKDYDVLVNTINKLAKERIKNDE